MKKLTISVLTITMLSTSVFAQSGDVSKVCRGEFSDKIVQSIQSCSEADLAKAMSEIGVLEVELAKSKAQLNNLLSKSGSNHVSHNQAEIIFGSSIIVTIFGASGALATLATAGQMGPGPGNFLRNAAWGSLVTLAMGIAGIYFGSTEKQRLEVEYKDIPFLRDFVSNLEAQVKIRKTMIEVATKIKLEQAK